MGIIKSKLLIFVLLVLCFTIGQYVTDTGSTEMKSYRLVEMADGERVIVPDEINRYATLVPSYTETLIDLGLEKNIVLADEDSAYLLEYNQDIETMDTDKLNINMEVGTIIDQKPDIILMDKTTYLKFNDNSLELIRKAGSQIIVLPVPKNINEIRDELAFLVELTQAKHGARLLASFDMKSRTIEDAYSKINEPVPVFFQIKDKNAITTCGEDVYINEIIKLAGGKNVFEDTKGIHYTSYEEISKKNPQYYIAMSNEDNYQQKHILTEKRLSETEAIRGNNVYVMDYYQTSNPNHRSLDAVLALGEILHSRVY